MSVIYLPIKKCWYFIYFQRKWPLGVGCGLGSIIIMDNLMGKGCVLVSILKSANHALSIVINHVDFVSGFLASGNVLRTI